MYLDNLCFLCDDYGGFNFFIEMLYKLIYICGFEYINIFWWILESY